MRIITGKDTLLATPEHPFYAIEEIPDAGRTGSWIPAGRLHKGLKVLLATGLMATVESTFAFDTIATVYNFEVANTHTYYVGNQGILVHNEYVCINSLTGRFVGTLESTLNHVGEIEYQFQDFEFFPNKVLDLVSHAKLADKPCILPNEKVLYMDFNIPIEVSEALRQNESYLGKVSLGKAMFDDAFERFTQRAGRPLDGIYGEWIESQNYPGGVSYNLEKFREGLILHEEQKEEAVFRTITGRWAKDKGYTRVEFKVPTNPNYSSPRVEVIFRRPL